MALADCSQPGILTRPTTTCASSAPDQPPSPLIPRFDARALYQALDQQRAARGLTWQQVAAESGVSKATIVRTQHGGRMEVDGMLALVRWLGVPVETFVRDSAS